MSIWFFMSEIESILISPHCEATAQGQRKASGLEGGEKLSNKSWYVYHVQRCIAKMY